MTEAEAAAQESLKEIVGELEGLRSRLLELHDSLPVPPQEIAMLEGEEDMDVAMEVRVVIECVLNDFIGSAIRDLQEAATFRVELEPDL
jgi:GTP cyclohydrolase II